MKQLNRPIDKERPNSNFGGIISSFGHVDNFSSNYINGNIVQRACPTYVNTYGKINYTEDPTKKKKEDKK